MAKMTRRWIELTYATTGSLRLEDIPYDGSSDSKTKLDSAFNASNITSGTLNLARLSGGTWGPTSKLTFDSNWIVPSNDESVENEFGQGPSFSFKGTYSTEYTPAVPGDPGEPAYYSYYGRNIMDWWGYKQFDSDGDIGNLTLTKVASLDADGTFECFTGEFGKLYATDADITNIDGTNIISDGIVARSELTSQGSFFTNTITLTGIANITGATASIKVRGYSPAPTDVWTAPPLGSIVGDNLLSNRDVHAQRNMYAVNCMIIGKGRQQNVENNTLQISSVGDSNFNPIAGYQITAIKTDEYGCSFLNHNADSDYWGSISNRFYFDDSIESTNIHSSNHVDGPDHFGTPSISLDTPKASLNINSYVSSYQYFDEDPSATVDIIERGIMSRWDEKIVTGWTPTQSTLNDLATIKFLGGVTGGFVFSTPQALDDNDDPLDRKSKYGLEAEIWGSITTNISESGNAVTIGRNISVESGIITVQGYSSLGHARHWNGVEYGTIVGDNIVSERDVHAQRNMYAAHKICVGVRQLNTDTDYSLQIGSGIASGTTEDGTGTFDPLSGTQITNISTSSSGTLFKNHDTTFLGSVAQKFWFDDAIDIINFTASTVALTVKGAASQSANLTNWTNSSNTTLMSVSSNGYLTLVGDPVNASHAATKSYVDGVATGLDFKESVKCATTASITLSGTQTIDGVSVIVGDRVLVKNQSTASGNGIYVVASGAWSRSADADVNSEVTSGMYTYVEQGTVNGQSSFVLTTTGTIVVGTTSLVFTKFSGAGQLTAGDGLSLTGNEFDINTGNGIQISSDAVALGDLTADWDLSASSFRIKANTPSSGADVATKTYVDGKVVVQAKTVTSTDLANRSFTLNSSPSSASVVTLMPEGGPVQYGYDQGSPLSEVADFSVSGTTLSWDNGADLDGLSEGERITIIYTT